MRLNVVIGIMLIYGLAIGPMILGCGADNPVASNSSRDQTTIGSEHRDTCRDDETAPFTVEELLEGMRAAGHLMYVAPGCSNRQASWQLTNYDSSVPGIEWEDYAATLTREGTVDCYVFGDGHDSGSRVDTESYEGENLVYFRVLNVGCNMRPDPAQWAQQVARLEETLNHLAASLTRSAARVEELFAKHDVLLMPSNLPMLSGVFYTAHTDGNPGAASVAVMSTHLEAREIARQEANPHNVPSRVVRRANVVVWIANDTKPDARIRIERAIGALG